MAETNRDWITRKLFEEYGLQFRTVWDLYLKTNAVLLTVNVAALALTVQYVGKENRIPIILAFVLQHVASTVTAVKVARYSKTTSERAKEIADLLLQEGEPAQAPSQVAVKESPIPGDLACWGALALGFYHVVFILIWVILAWI